MEHSTVDTHSSGGNHALCTLIAIGLLGGHKEKKKQRSPVRDPRRRGSGLLCVKPFSDKKELSTSTHGTVSRYLLFFYSHNS